jgi:hypothetical protein
MFTENLPVYGPANSLVNSFSTQIVERLFLGDFEIRSKTPGS